MKHLILNTSADFTGFVLRLTAGSIMLVHGVQKSLAFRATMTYFTDTMNLPWIIAFGVIFIETLGSVGLIAGAFSRIWALGLIFVMLGAIVTTNAKNGLFMNWYGTQGGEGYEYHLLFIGICIAIMICGSGKFSVDEVLTSR
jgi:putative oxidoreductase